MVVRELITKLGYKVDQKGLTQYERGLQRLERTTNKVGKSLTTFVSLPLTLIGGFSLKAAADVEQLGMAFTTMLGSAEKADAFIRDLMSFAAKTPFEIENIGPVAKQLLAVGFEAEEVIPTLKSVGDVAAGLGVPLSRLVLNLGQVKTQGKLTGRELRDFAVSGVPLIEALADSMGVTKAEIADLTSKGKISFDMVMDAFRDMSSEGGRFANLMEKQAGTLAGLWSNLVDQTYLARTELGNMIVETLRLKDATKALAEQLEKVVGWLKELPEWARATIVVTGLLVIALGPALLAASKILAVFTFLTLHKTAALAVLGSLKGALMGIAAVLFKIILPLGVIALLVQDYWAWTRGYPSVFGEMVGPIEEFMDNVVFWIDRIKTWALKVIEDVKNEWLMFVDNILYWLEKIPFIGGPIRDLIEGTAEAAGEAAAGAVAAAGAPGGPIPTGGGFGGAGLAAAARTYAAGAGAQQRITVGGAQVNVTVPPGTPAQQAADVASAASTAVQTVLNQQAREIAKSSPVSE